ncbi:MAG: sigma-70 family RNA polymerase sigma factor [Bacteroidota bacterium]
MLTFSQTTAEQQLIKGCLSGQRADQKVLYEHFAPKMFGICQRYAAGTSQAEDMLQEGFIKVFNNLHRFRGEGSFEGWIKRIFINTSIEYHRKAIRKHLHLELTPLDDPAVSPQAMQNLIWRDLLQLIQQLPVGYRTVFNLYVIEGFSHQEISELLGISPGTSKSQLARARYMLQSFLKSRN